MRRRSLLVAALVGVSAALGSANPAAAQPLPRMVRIGVLAPEPSPLLDGLRQGLRALGYVEGETVRIEYRFAEGRAERLPMLAAALVAMPVEVIVTFGTTAALAARDATSSIPIVMGALGDPVAAGLVSNLAHPGGNVTGLSSLTAETEPKRLEMLRDLLPRLARVVVLSNPINPYSAIALSRMREAAQAMRLGLDVVELARDGELGAAFSAIRAHNPDAVLVIPDQFLLRHREAIASFMAESRLPAIYAFREHVEAGGLLSYTANRYDQFRRAAVYVDKIVKGAKPGDLPVEQAAVFELSINLKAAGAIDLTIPPALLARADEVIE
jgi:putative ABC transport system substrate-binding protein